ncbi:MAG TPA: hypothetical protein VKU87_11445, partial [Thermomicrobiaceae bacterium]|nr:hypothetical protein [Thermomicrobiaceae bacterium]
MRMAHAAPAADADGASRAARSKRFGRNLGFVGLGIAACLALILASFGLAGSVAAAGSPTTVTVGGSPINVAVNPNTSHVFVADDDYVSPGVSDFADSVLTPTNSGKIAGAGFGQYSSEGNVPWGVAVDTATNHVFVSNNGSHVNENSEYLPAPGYSVTIIDDSTSLPSTQAGTIAGLSSPLGIAANPSTEHVFVFTRGVNGNAGAALAMIQDSSSNPTTIAGQIPLPYAYDASTDEYTADTTVASIAVDPTTNMIYLADEDQAGCGCVYAFQDSDTLSAGSNGGVISVNLTKIPVGTAFDPSN